MKKMKVILIVIVCLLAGIVLAAGGFLYKNYLTARNNNYIPTVTATPLPAADASMPTAEPAPNDLSFATLDPASFTPSPTPQPEATPIPIYKTDRYNEDIINVLLVGIDPREEDADKNSTGNSDSMMLVSVNMKTHRVCIFSFMRDGACYINNKSGFYDKINKAYSNGGIGMLINTLNGSRNFQLDIQNYVSITFKMFEHIIDEFGGIELELTETDCEFINKKCQHEAEKKKQTTWTTIPVKNGKQLLTGETALWYCRDRYSDQMGDWGRTLRQRRVLQIMYDKLRKEWTLPKLMNVINYVAENSATNLSAEAIVQLASIAMENDFTVETVSVPFPGMATNSTNKKGKFILRYDMNTTRDTLLGVIYDGDPMPDGVQTDFAGSNED